MNDLQLTRPVALTREHDTSQFLSSHDSLNEWLKDKALKSEARSARTYVVCNGSAVVGYYCLATGAVSRNAAPRKLRQNMPDPIPVMVIGRLAVDRNFERRGIGTGMLKDGLQRIVQVAEQIGCRAVLVHAIDAEAVGFYAGYGFSENPSGPRTMFLPIETARAAIVGAVD